MKKQKRNNANGITLIALVISIIVMLILAGVSINALVGDNGVLTQTQYASFLNEMSAVEEAVDIWKAGKTIEDYGVETNAIPTSGMCNATELQNTERLVGEVGYYRVWSIGKTIPAVNVLSIPKDFNDAFQEELVFYPAGVQDLYYLNNEAVGISGNKKYIIDAATSMIYSMTGIGIKGTRVYSSAMAKAVMNGDTTMPLFAEAEVSGAGNNIIYAGSEYLKNKDGQYIDENGNVVSESSKVINPYGFEIVSSPLSSNIYKLYNNGDLYAKGIISVGLDSTTRELDSIDEYLWAEFKVPESISSYKKVLLGRNTVFVFTNDNKIYVYGNNSSNKLGLTQEEQKEFTGRNAIEFKPKDNTGNMINVKDIYCFDSAMFIIDNDNKVFSCGINYSEDSSPGALGIGTSETGVSVFHQCIGLPNGKIKRIEEDYKREGLTNTLVLYEDGTIYKAGGNDSYIDSTNTFKFVTDGSTLDGKIIDIAGSRFYYSLILTDNGSVYRMYRKWETGIGYVGLFFDKLDVTNAVEIHSYRNHQPYTIKDSAGNWYFYDYINEPNNNGCIGFSVEKAYDSTTSTYKSLVNLNECLDSQMFVGGDSIKQLICSLQGIATYLYIMESGKIWSSGNIEGMGLGKTYMSTSSVSVLTEVTLIYDPNNSNSLAQCLGNQKKIVGTQNSIFTYDSDATGVVFLINEEGKAYITGNQSLMYLDNIINNAWKKIASNVKRVFVGDTNRIAYIDNAGKGYVALSDLRDIGVDSISNTPIAGSNNFYEITAITEKISSIQFVTGASYVLTENGNLYSAGRDRYDTTWLKGAHTGFAPTAGAIKQLTILDSNVKCFGTSIKDVAYVKNDKVRCFGALGYGRLYDSTWNTIVYEPVDSPRLTNATDIVKIEKIYCQGHLNSFVLSDGDIYISGAGASQFICFTNQWPTKYVWSDLGLDGKIVDVVNDATANILVVLTEKGTVYGMGYKNRLGIGENSTALQNNFKDLGLENIISITCTKEGVVAVNNKGQVFGTGFNTYGVLGRWKGEDRGSSNSRYRTAIYWVECPELEI